jgi:hypothetical protein
MEKKMNPLMVPLLAQGIGKIDQRHPSEKPGAARIAGLNDLP